ncbi:hypothetical protein QBC46DRAFT_411079 [Diplogelasinospora grovesii]|uniref:2EXR domain-containing protein n=1 Tax=Diplogelasinospora grovesii TaxID=303347 RepID=A0AAN6S2K3_9PEZI|nr:hypothetical protein QBC46DRAFT_411079 [Diplogelasinospora grovesii]
MEAEKVTHERTHEDSHPNKENAPAQENPTPAYFRFEDLPNELKWQIWELALPRRLTKVPCVFEIADPHTQTSRPPGLTQVSRGWRAFAQSYYQVQSLDNFEWIVFTSNEDAICVLLPTERIKWTRPRDFSLCSTADHKEGCVSLTAWVHTDDCYCRTCRALDDFLPEVRLLFVDDAGDSHDDVVTEPIFYRLAVCEHCYSNPFNAYPVWYREPNIMPCKCSESD